MVNKTWARATSEVIKNDYSPNFTSFDNTLYFRGTYNELLSQKLRIHLYKYGVLSNTLIGSKLINLRTFMLTNIVKLTLNIHDNQLATLKGLIRAPKMPRYQQKDFTDDVITSDYYLVIHIQKLDVFSSLEDKGDFGVFCTVEWGGILIKSKTVRSALINETFHFNIPLDNDIINDENKLIDFLNDDLKTKSDVRFNVWVDFGDQLVDNLGTGYASLAFLYNVDPDEKMFKDTLTRKKIRFVTRIYNGKINLRSAFNDASS